MRYRCFECGDHEHLFACAAAVTFGPLDENGELATHDDVSDTEVFVSSIDCELHPGAILEAFVDGQWMRWVTCPGCDGRYDYCGTCRGAGGSWSEPSPAYSSAGERSP